MKSPSARALVVSPSAFARTCHAARWLSAIPSGREVLLLGASTDATASLVRPLALARGATFGWHRLGLGRLAATLAAPALAELGLVPVGALPLEALCAHVVQQLAEEGRLGRFARVADRPGLPRALARTVRELRLAGVAPGDGFEDEDLARVLAAYVAELKKAKLADRAEVLSLATGVAKSGQHLLLGHPTLLLDVAVDGGVEREFVASLAARSPDVLATVPKGDERSLAHLRAALETTEESLPPVGEGSLRRLQEGLFSESLPEPGALLADVALLSAPGESRECVEIARRIHREAEAGVPFDRMAILLRSVPQYRAHIEEAMRRASIPVFFAQGTVEPDPGGRAFLALLACAAEGLSARRFAEYLSLGEVPDVDAEGGPPSAPSTGDRWVAPDEDSLPSAIARAGEETGSEARESGEESAPSAYGPDVTSGGTLRAPRRWERLLVEAAVIGGLSRWEKRICGLSRERELDLAALEDPDDPLASRIRREIDDLESLRRYALPLLQALDALPRQASWRTWLDALTALATRALRRPDRVLGVLAELAPLGAMTSEGGAVGTSTNLSEVRLALGRRLTDLVVPPASRRYGRVYVGPAEGARGLVFDVVFVPGLAEKLFPQKVSQDPILRDIDRDALASGLATDRDRARGERLALHLAVGAARRRVVLSYPRLDAEQSRPRTPSFYGLEVLRAAEGKLPGFDELGTRAEQASGTRLGWPAPLQREDAIDDAEHDLSLLATIFQRDSEETKGAARYLLSVNRHLARALRFRAARWNLKGWTPADGLVSPGPEARVALDKHAFRARSYSPTALQNFASCPYKFVLYAIHKLSPRQEPEALEELDPLQRGSLIHEVLFDLHVELRDAGLLPISPDNQDDARARLDRVLDVVAGKYKEDLAPAIERVWDDGVASIRADLREWLRCAALDTEWTPAHFELSFGLTERRAKDPLSKDAAVTLASGVRLRGSIDLVEKNRVTGAYRASDYKTGKARAPKDTVIGGGEILQPVLYALVLEDLLPGAKVESGRLYYCTSTGDFEDRTIALDGEARAGALSVAEVIGQAIDEGFLPAAPADGACLWCDYKVVCGPYEEQRVKGKRQDKLKPLVLLRKKP